MTEDIEDVAIGKPPDELVGLDTVTSTTSTTLGNLPRHDLDQRFKTVPIVYDERERGVQLGARVLASSTLSGIVNWYTLLEKNSDISIHYFRIRDELGEGEIATREGWNMRVRLGSATETELENLKMVLRDDSTDRQKLEYIDVRYGNRIYWK